MNIGAAFSHPELIRSDKGTKTQDAPRRGNMETVPQVALTYLTGPSA